MVSGAECASAKYHVDTFRLSPPVTTACTSCAQRGVLLVTAMRAIFKYFSNIACIRTRISFSMLKFWYQSMELNKRPEGKTR